MKVSKKLAIVASLVLVLFVSASIYYVAASRNNSKSNVNDNVTEDQNISNEVEDEDDTESNSQSDTNEVKEEIYDYTSQNLGVGIDFSGFTVVWDSINSQKSEKTIYIRTKIGSIWSEWEKYNLSLDPKTRNSTYTTGEITKLNGSEAQYSFNFEEGEYIRGLLLTFSGDIDKKILVDEVKSE